MLSEGEGHHEAPRSSDSEQGFDPATSPVVAKYWRQHHSFSRYDESILMDEEGWFSITLEAIAAAQAACATFKSDIASTIVLDCFAGVGGNAIQFALRGCFVVAIEIDPVKVEFVVNNVKIYGVEDKIDFIVGASLNLCQC